MTLAKQAYKANPFETQPVNGATFVIGAETANVINVGIQLKNGLEDLSHRACINAYLSDDANGDSVAGTAPTTVAIGTDGVIMPLIAGKVFLLTSEADGDIDINITLSSGADTWYLVLVMPDGTLKVSGAITFAS
jgi:hypothetical protein